MADPTAARALPASETARDAEGVARARSARPLRIVHVVTDLWRGGAEMALARLVAATQSDGLDHRVISLCGDGPVGESIREAGGEVSAVDLRAPLAAPAELVRLSLLLRGTSADVVHCWMYHANLIGGLAARASTRARIVWGLRSGSPAAVYVGRRTAGIARAAAALSRFVPARIVCPSESTATAHAAAGYARDRIVVIPNGFDTELFRPSAERRRRARASLRVPDDAPLVGLVANVSPIKDHATFVAAAARLARELPTVHFALCGEGATEENSELRARIQASGASERFRLLGVRDDVPDILTALDLFTLCSRREAFPNALGEAMACGLPCVATAVGGIPELGGGTVQLVREADPLALAGAWRELLLGTPERRTILGRAARRRIVEHFSIAASARRHVELYESALAGAVPPASLPGPRRA
jgi:glycosyltransferase involved in cell wall biosynthesis